MSFSLIFLLETSSLSLRLHSGWSTIPVTARLRVRITSSTANPTTPVSRTTLPTLVSNSRRASSPPNKERTTSSGATRFVVIMSSSSSSSAASATDLEEEEEAEGSVLLSTSGGREKWSESGRPRRLGGAASSAGKGKERENVGGAGGGGGGGDADVDASGDDDDELEVPAPVPTEMGTTRGVSADGAGYTSRRNDNDVGFVSFLREGISVFRPG